MVLSDLDVPGTEWMVDLADVLEESLIETVGDLARLDVNNEELALKLTRARSYGVARRTVWIWKRAAAALLEVELDEEVPAPLQKPAKRSPAAQHALDVASRWVAHADAPDAKLETEYAEALAAIALDCVAKQQKKKRRR